MFNSEELIEIKKCTELRKIQLEEILNNSLDNNADIEIIKELKIVNKILDTIIIF